MLHTKDTLILFQTGSSFLRAAVAVAVQPTREPLPVILANLKPLSRKPRAHPARYWLSSIPPPLLPLPPSSFFSPIQVGLGHQAESDGLKTDQTVRKGSNLCVYGSPISSGHGGGGAGLIAGLLI